MGIYITGDIHGNPMRFGKKAFYEQNAFSDNKTDNVIIQLGDFGIIWSNEPSREEKYNLKWLSERNFTVAFIDGNHDNIPRLDTYPVKEWNGGLVNEVMPNVVRLKRGEVYTIEGKKFFAFGGAQSHDISDGILDGSDSSWRKKAKELEKEEKYRYRVKGLSWWEEELPSQEEMDNGIKNLDKHDWTVDFIITHSPPSSVLALIGHGTYKQDRLTEYLESIHAKANFNKWFMGHMHINRALNDRDMLLYEQIIRIN